MEFSHLRKHRRFALSRGFTLVELMVVVIIIGILSTLAIPQLTERMRERRASEAGQTVAALYRDARLRAMGRGFPVLVSYVSGSGFQVQEAVLSAANSDCKPHLPVGCVNTQWAVPASSQLVDSFNPEQFAGLTATVTDSTTGATVTRLYTCYSARGRTFGSSVAASALAPQTDMVNIAMKRPGSSLNRNVSILPNGMARMAL